MCEVDKTCIIYSLPETIYIQKKKTHTIGWYLEFLNTGLRRHIISIQYNDDD